MASETRSVRVRSLSLRRHNEKNELQELNETLGDFIQRVKQLELTNHQLRTQVDALKHNWGMCSLDFQLSIVETFMHMNVL